MRQLVVNFHDIVYSQAFISYSLLNLLICLYSVTWGKPQSKKYVFTYSILIINLWKIDNACPYTSTIPLCDGNNSSNAVEKSLFSNFVFDFLNQWNFLTFSILLKIIELIFNLLKKFSPWWVIYPGLLSLVLWFKKSL